MTTTETKLKELREELMDLVRNPKKYPLKKGSIERKKYEELKEKIAETEKAYKDNEMYLFIQAQNIVHKKLNELIPVYNERITGIFGEKFYNMDSSRNHKFKTFFDDLEGEIKKELKNYTYRITTRTRLSYSNFILDVSVRIWNENGSKDYSNFKYLATVENGTSFKEVYDFTEEYETYNVKTELKKLNKYQAEKAKLDKLKKTLNTDFMKQFAFYFDKDRF